MLVHAALQALPLDARALACRDVDLAVELGNLRSEAPAVGSRVRARVQKSLAFGLACEVEGAPQMAGLLTEAHCPSPPPSIGQAVAAVVLDVHPVDGILDLSASKVCRLPLCGRCVMRRRHDPRLYGPSMQ